MKNKKLTILTILITIPLSFTGCANQEAGADVPASADGEIIAVFEDEPEKEDIIPINELIVPSYLNGDETEDFSIAEEGEDSVTYHLDEVQQAEAVDQVSSQLKDSVNQVLADKDFYPNITKISVSKNYSVFDVTFSGTEINTYETTLRMSLYIAGDKLQLYQGVPEDKLLTTVNYINSETGEVFSTGDSSNLH